MVTLSTSGSSIIFTFQDNAHYLQNGVIETPKNSLTLVTDESNMATFKKIDGDIFISALYSELGMSKSELETWFKENAVGSTGGGTDTGTVQTMIDESISGKADSVSAVSSAEYVSSSTTINFKNIDGDIISSIDASDFVIDGMIDDVRIETISGESYLVIDFNTASGKEDIQIPISDIFDADNYYTKAEVDAIASGKVDTSAYTPVTVSSAITEGDTNAVAGGAVFDKIAISTNIPTSGVVLTFDEQEYSTNYPAYTNRLELDFSGLEPNVFITNSVDFYDSEFEELGIKVEIEYVNATGEGETKYYVLETTGCTATTAETSLTIEFENNNVAYVTWGDNDRVPIRAYGPDAFWIKDTKQDKLTAGNGINIDSGNTISLSVPVSSSTRPDSIIFNRWQNKANGGHSIAAGYGTTANGSYSFASGLRSTANNQSEFATGQFNVSSSASTTFGDSGNTLFSVGNGTFTNACHNAFEIRQNGDIYITSGGTDIKLQDNLGGGIDSGTAQTMIDESISGKAETSAVTSVNDALTAHTADTTIHVTTADKTAWNAKSDFSGSYNDLTDKPTIPTVPTSNTAFTNDAGYITSDALSGYAESSAVTVEINAATSGKVDTSSVVSSVTSASTYSEIPTAKAVYDAIPTGGTSITIDPTLDSGSTNPVANSAITTAIDAVSGAVPTQYVKKIEQNSDNGVIRFYDVWKESGYAFVIYNFSINGKMVLSKQNGTYPDVYNFNLVETSAVTSSMTSSSTDAEIPSAKAVYDQFGGLKLVKLTQVEYDALVSGGTVDNSTIYYIVN